MVAARKRKPEVNSISRSIISRTTEEARENELNFKDMPVGGLFVLRNVTKGHEERIFTYVDGQQVWW